LIEQEHPFGIGFRPSEQADELRKTSPDNPQWMFALVDPMEGCHQRAQIAAIGYTGYTGEFHRS
jgi:hypothetical protein